MRKSKFVHFLFGLKNIVQQQLMDIYRLVNRWHIISSNFDERLTVRQIARITRYSIRTVYRITELFNDVIE